MQTLIKLDNQGLEWLTHIITESACEARVELQLENSWSVEDLINFVELVSINAKTKLLTRVRGLPSKDVYQTLGSFVDQICHTLLEDGLDDLRDTHIEAFV
jgi:hypothetical protein